jgi:hypothetical protein
LVVVVPFMLIHFKCQINLESVAAVL